MRQETNFLLNILHYFLCSSIQSVHRESAPPPPPPRAGAVTVAQLCRLQFGKINRRYENEIRGKPADDHLTRFCVFIWFCLFVTMKLGVRRRNRSVKNPPRSGVDLDQGAKPGSMFSSFVRYGVFLTFSLISQRIS